MHDFFAVQAVQDQGELEFAQVIDASQESFFVTPPSSPPLPPSAPRPGDEGSPEWHGPSVVDTLSPSLEGADVSASIGDTENAVGF